MSYQNKGETGIVAVVTSEGRGGNFTFAAGADPALAIEAAWSYLGTLGGGTLITKGAGETWTTQSQIDSQSDDVHWMSDWSLMIQAQGGLDADVVSTTHDRVFLEGLYIDGNHSSGDWGVGEYHGLRFEGSVDSKILRCRVKEVHNYGISATQTSTRMEIAHCWIHDCRWNDISIQSYTSYFNIHDNLIEEASDVGIALTNQDFAGGFHRIHHNLIRNIDNTEGSGAGGGSGWGIAVEGEMSHVLIHGNIIEGCRGPGIITSDSAYAKTHVEISDNIIYDCGNAKAGTIFAAAIFAASTEGLQIEGNIILDSGINNGYGIHLDTPANGDFSINDNMIRAESTITTKYYALYITTGNGIAANNHIDIESSGGTQRCIFIDGADDIIVEGNTLKNAATGIYGDNMDDVMIKNNRIQCTTPIDVNRAACVRPMIMGNNWEGSTNDASTGAATNERITANVDRNGAWWGTGDAPN